MPSSILRHFCGRVEQDQNALAFNEGGKPSTHIYHIENFVNSNFLFAREPEPVKYPGLHGCTCRSAGEWMAAITCHGS